MTRLEDGATFRFQKDLPKLPVPALEDTFKKFMVTVEPYMENESDREQLKRDVEATLADPHVQESQRTLLEMQGKLDSWLGEMWISGAYLQWRAGLAINSNVTGYLFGEHRKKWDPLFSAASVTHGTLLYHKALLDGTVEPDIVKGRGGKPDVPNCMDQYTRMFSLTRIPGVVEDLLVKYKESESRHIAVCAGNRVFTVQVITEDRNVISIEDLAAAFHYIFEQVKTSGKAEYPLPVLTTTNRTEWASARNRLKQDPLNAASLNQIESSIFTVALEEDIDENDDACGKGGLVGDGRSVWFDKSMTLRIRGDGNPAINIEHSWADAPVPLGMFFNHALAYAEKLEKDGQDKTLLASVKQSGGWSSTWGKPEQLEWNFTDSLVADIRSAEAYIDGAIADSDVRIYRCPHLGKTAWKAAGLSPDAAVQMAMQLAYRKLTNSPKPVATYETIGMVSWRNGRTETCRVVSKDSEAFVKGVLNGYLKSRTEENRKEAEALLRKACDAHLDYIRQGQLGKGVDRHMFGLRMVAKDPSHVPALFKNKLFAESGSTGGFIISTSNNSYVARPFGGLFGCVMPNGYGVCYIPRTDETVLCVESKRSCAETDSLVFCKAVEECLRDIAIIAGVPRSKL